VGIYRCLIDAGHKTDLVYELAMRYPSLFIPCIGRTEKQGLYSPIRDSSIDYKGRRIPLFIVNDKHFKDALYLSIIKDGLQKWYLPQNIDDDLRAQLTSERLVERKVSNKLVTDWVCSNRNNHLSDCFKYILGFKYRMEPQLEILRKQAATPEPPKREYVIQQPVYSSGGGWD
jgi:hypothetical protein